MLSGVVTEKKKPANEIAGFFFCITTGPANLPVKKNTAAALRHNYTPGAFFFACKIRHIKHTKAKRKEQKIC